MCMRVCLGSLCVCFYSFGFVFLSVFVDKCVCVFQVNKTFSTSDVSLFTGVYVTATSV